MTPEDKIALRIAGLEDQAEIQSERISGCNVRITPLEAHHETSGEALMRLVTRGTDLSDKVERLWCEQQTEIEKLSKEIKECCARLEDLAKRVRKNETYFTDKQAETQRTVDRQCQWKLKYAKLLAAAKAARSDWNRDARYPTVESFHSSMCTLHNTIIEQEDTTK